MSDPSMVTVDTGYELEPFEIADARVWDGSDGQLRPVFDGNNIDMRFDLHDYNMVEYAVVIDTDIGKLGQAIESLAAELEMLGRPDHLVEHYQRRADELYGRARLQAREAGARAAASAWDLVNHPARKCRSVSRTGGRARRVRSRRGAGGRAGPSDDGGEGAGEGCICDLDRRFAEWSQRQDRPRRHVGLGRGVPAPLPSSKRSP